MTPELRPVSPPAPPGRQSGRPAAYKYTAAASRLLFRYPHSPQQKLFSLLSMEEGKAVVLERKDEVQIRETKKVYPKDLPSRYVRVLVRSTGICGSGT